MEIGIGTLSLMHPEAGIEGQTHPPAVYLLLGCRPEREQDRRQLLQVISQLSEIARNM